MPFYGFWLVESKSLEESPDAVSFILLYFVSILDKTMGGHKSVNR